MASAPTHPNNTKWRPITQTPPGERFISIPMRLLAIAPACAVGLPVYVAHDLRDPRRMRSVALSDRPLGAPAAEALHQRGFAFAYFRAADLSRLQARLLPLVPKLLLSDQLTLPDRCRLAYNAGVHLIEEMLTTETPPDGERLSQLCQAIATLFLSDRRCFQCFFDAAPHDPHVAKHSMNVAVWMCALAGRLGESDASTLAEICQAGIVHDIGKRFVPEEILSSNAQLSSQELALIRRHPELGHSYLRPIPHVSKRARRVCLEHHERLDGSGYPRNLKGSAICHEARICSVIDAFDAMTAMRPIDRRALTAHEALDAIETQAPGKYDPQIVSVWREMVTRQVSFNGQQERRVDRRVGAQRFSNRAPLELPAVIRTLTPAQFPRSAPAEQATLVNRSRTGLCLLCRRNWPPHTWVEIVVQPDSADRECCQARVVRARPLADGSFQIGLRLLDPREAAPG